MKAVYITHNALNDIDKRYLATVPNNLLQYVKFWRVITAARGNLTETIVQPAAFNCNSESPGIKLVTRWAHLS